MAYTTSTLVNSYMGEFRLKMLRVTADAATQTIDTELGNINFMIPTPVSHVAASTLSANVAVGWVIYPNSNASGVAALGSIGISNAVSGDVYDIVCFGTD